MLTIIRRCFLSITLLSAVSMEQNKDSRPNKIKRVLFYTILLLVIVAVIHLYYATFGKVDLTELVENKLVKHNRWVDPKIKKLESSYASTVDLKRKLDSYVSRIFWGFRIVSALQFIVFNIYVYNNCGVDGFFDRLERVMNVNEAVFLFFLIWSFLFTKKFLDFTSLIKSIHLKTTKIVYRNFDSLNEDFIRIQSEIETIGFLS